MSRRSGIRFADDAVSLVFATYGVFGFIGLVIASRIVDGWGGSNTSLLATALVLAGMGVWAVGAGSLTAMAVGVAIWGLGFASTNSMQQVRLVGAAPTLATASVSLNTFGALHRPGGRFGDRRNTVCPRSAAGHRLRSDGLRRAGADHGDCDTQDIGGRLTPARKRDPATVRPPDRVFKMLRPIWTAEPSTQRE